MFRDMGWLPPPPADFRYRVRALQREVRGSRSAMLGERIIGLASTALDGDQLVSLSRLAAEIAEDGREVEPLSRAKMGFLGDGTLSLSSPAIAGSALRHSLLLEIVEGGYNSAVQEAVVQSSPLRTAGLDMVVVACDARLLGLDRAAPSTEFAVAKVEAAFQRLSLIVDSLRPSVASTIFVQTVVPPMEPLFGSFDRVERGSPFAMVEALNGRIADWAATGAIGLIDIARLATAIGLEHWDDPRHWHASKLSFTPEFIPVYADVIARTIASALGKARKCLVLDLDDTLWGGVIGDDGLEGIEIGQGSATGEAFLAVQCIALELRGRGIMLAVSSKNEDEAARLPFREHAEMLLREDHIAVFQANWTDKAANLRAIAKTLNIGVESLVLLDDNPAERMRVRQQMPLVAVPELPDDPAYFPRVLAAAGYFEAVSVSAEDRQRAHFYEANKLRAAAVTATGDLASYLESLEMVCTIRTVDAMSRTRVAQLINKSNQYNLTTRRYSEVEVAAAEADPARHVVQIRLVDRFGDNGIISVIIADKKTDRWEIDTWLMSCRVLGRRVEEAALAHLASAATREGASQIVGRYIPSSKNRMVADHYAKLGFAQVERTADGGGLWRLDLNEYRSRDLPMRVDDACQAIPDIVA
jgi:FkbH-like protein